MEAITKYVHLSGAQQKFWIFIFLIWFNYVSKTIYHMQLKWKYCTYLKKIQNNFILIIIGKTYFIFSLI